MTDSSWPELEDGEVEVKSEELLWRQIHPARVDGEIVAKLAFMPGGGDEGKLSVARETKVSADASYREFTGFGYASCGVLAVSTPEVREEDLRVADDSEASSAPSPCPTGHSYVDFRRIEKPATLKRKAANLRDAAMRRGWSHRPEQNKE